MTTFTMIVGMFPMAMGLGAGGEFRSGIGTVIIGGLISSLLLTLVLVPCSPRSTASASSARLN